VAALFAFLHHLTAFVLVAAIRGALTVDNARKLRVVDAVYGASAGLLLAVGLLRVFYFEKGAAFYFGNAFFIAKLALFILVGLLSIYPTLEIASWRKQLAAGRAPVVAATKLHAMRRVIHWELAGIVLILLCAALMARAIGQL
jgi:putative membrane protein